MTATPKVEALSRLMHEDHQLKVSQASARRCGKACAVLGLSRDEAEVMCARLSLYHKDLRPSFMKGYDVVWKKAMRRVQG